MLENEITRLPVGMHEVEWLHRHEPLGNIAFSGDGGQEIAVETAADNGSRLQEAAIVARKPVDARSKQGTQAVGQRGRERSAVEFETAGRPLNRSSLKQVACDFLRKQWVAFGSFCNSAGKIPRHLRKVEPAPNDLRCFRERQRIELDRE